MITILDEGDYHDGDRLGLCDPCHAGEYAPLIQPMWDFRERELKALGPVDLHILGGDLTEGPATKGSMGVHTSNLDKQAEWAIEAIERVKLKKGGSRFFCYGSDYHVVYSSNVEHRIAEHFNAPLKDYIRLKVKGKRFEWRHFVGRSDVERGVFAQDAREITRALIQEVLDGYEAADVFGRHHVHYYSRVGIKDREAYTCPAWKLPLDIPESTYPRRLRTQYYDVGYTLIHIDNAGEVYIRPRRMKLSALYPREYLCPLG